MKYVKMIGLLAVAATALMAFASTASATTLTSPKGTTYTGEIHAIAGETTLHGVKTITCTSSTASGNVETHGTSSTVEGNIGTLTFSGCGTDDVTVEINGKLIVHTDPNNSMDGTVTSDGATILIHVTSLGLTCGYKTEATHIGTLTSSETTNGTPVLMIDSSAIPRHSGSFFCGSSGEWTGEYSVTTPMELWID
jgi:hypothetical protein